MFDVFRNLQTDTLYYLKSPDPPNLSKKEKKMRKIKITLCNGRCFDRPKIHDATSRPVGSVFMSRVDRIFPRFTSLLVRGSPDLRRRDALKYLTPS